MTTIARVLIVGLGSIGRRHLGLARRMLPDADIRILRHAETQEIPEGANGCVFDLDAALAFRPQLAVIANPAPYHVAVALPLAELGVHLLVEKPMAAEDDGLDRLIETARLSGAVLMVGYNLRFNPALRRFRELVRAGEVGRVMSVRAEVGQDLPSWRKGTDYRQGVSARRTLGGGVLLELSHEIDYLRWLFGDIAWVNATLARQSDLEIDVEDTAYLQVGFRADASGRELTGTLAMDFIRHDHTRICVAIGEAGSLRWNGLAGTVEKFAPGATGWREIYSSEGIGDSYMAEWETLLSCAAEARPVPIPGADGRAVIKIVEAVRRSAATGAVAIVDGME